MSHNRSSMSPEFYTMNGGDGPYSYSNNSRAQRLFIEISKPIIDEAIMNDLDLRSFSLSSNPFSIVDLGCSTGPNTFMAVQNILDSIKQKYKSHIPDCTIPEFMIYFNDHSSNDFNTLFASLPPNRQYFVAAVPGSFHGRLFPESSVHFFHSSNAIHWLSKAPEELLDRKSLAWNKGRVHYTNAAKEVCDAYATQFGKDMEKFLDARGKEIVVGGLMVLTVSGIPNGMRLSHQNPIGLLYHILGASLMGLVKKRASIEAAKDIIDEAISKELDLTKLSLTSNAFSIVDLGCSTGPNTFIAVQNILDSIKQKYQSLSLDSEIPEFLVYFNDLTSNDFNTLFASLPPNGQYFAAAVPGSFHGRLFPESSIHFFHSSSALHWLSKVPDECLDKNSPAWNKGRVHYTNAGSEVYDAYAAQFAEDMGMFLEARAKEIVFGGMMALILSGIESGMCHSKQPVGLLYDLLGASLMDLAEKGVISEEEVDSFNLPLHTATPEEMREIVEGNGSFSLVRMEMMESKLMMDAFLTNVLLATMILRSNTEDIISKHFGSGVMDEVCQRLSAKALDIAKKLNPEEYQGYHLLVILKRN